MTKIFVPPIKSQGIKTKLVPWIASVVPSDFSGRWIEPFSGTGVVGLNLAPKEALLADKNPHLINFYNAINRGEIGPDDVRAYLEREGEQLASVGEDHYYYIRERFNNEGSPLDFLFINRAGFNGMIRFNRKGRSNIPFCRKPGRFAPAYVTRIVNQVRWVQQTLRTKQFTFVCQDFATTVARAEKGDIIYCDPPYIDRHVDYFGAWGDTEERTLRAVLSESRANFILSTWHHNDYRSNDYIESLWSDDHMLTRDHFYHVGGREENRNPMVEALVTNLPLSIASESEPLRQMEFEIVD
ncbi:Dam family site-specific DNA-(adenine-N6)-methyltransferase [Novosphingobium sp.]|uniref:DNA adenine methylase n=1 Tax=Novosphingobium sp. TaxID=1874826 RepID=UPI0025DCACEF|nr:Dam family site-specific DNA-(adenine-N6)-methyltransferase [Novosphingobium sp.]